MQMSCVRCPVFATERPHYFSSSTYLERGGIGPGPDLKRSQNNNIVYDRNSQNIYNSSEVIMFNDVNQKIKSGNIWAEHCILDGFHTKGQLPKLPQSH